MASGENIEMIEIGTHDGKADLKSCPGQNNLRVKPIRIIQLVLSTILLGLTIGLTQDIALDIGNLSLLGIINFSFFIVEIVDAVSQFGNDPIPDTPMFVFGSSGVVFFLIASGGSFAIFAIRNKSSGLLVAIGIFSFFAAFVHLMDVILIFLFGY